MSAKRQSRAIPFFWFAAFLLLGSSALSPEDVVLEDGRSTIDEVLPQVGEENVNCPQIECRATPKKCPKGTTIGQPKTKAGCPLCKTCVNSNNHAVKVPACFRHGGYCVRHKCPKGYKRILVKPAGKDGAKPCCPVYKCSGKACPPLRCPLPPTGCPKGAKKGVPKGANGCKQCVTCVSKKTGQAVKVPKCFRGRVYCPQKRCATGQKAKLLLAQGKDGAKPCCSLYRCVGKPCPNLACLKPPWKCPAGSKLGTPTNKAGCPLCKTCLDLKKKTPVPVPVCYKMKSLCFAPMCLKGFKSVLVKKAGKKGAAPCCDIRKCSPVHQCPTLKCAPPPYKCPKGSKLNLKPKGADGCHSCPACLDQNGKDVPVPKCYQKKIQCIKIGCKKGEGRVKVTAAGSNGAEPCCTKYKCVKCPNQKCAGAPRKCPKGSKFGRPKSTIGCPLCKTCLDGKGKPVPVPKCFQHKDVCSIPSCSQGQKRKLVKKRGPNGPCCDLYKCVGKPCPNLMCPVRPSNFKCPPGTKLVTPKTKSGCPLCKKCYGLSNHQKKAAKKKAKKKAAAKKNAKNAIKNAIKNAKKAVKKKSKKKKSDKWKVFKGA